jgi:hypothetical protein
VERGFQREDSTVTVSPAAAPHDLNKQDRQNARALLTVGADCISILGSNHMYLGGECLLVFSPEHTTTIAASVFLPGWGSRSVMCHLPR